MSRRTKIIGAWLSLCLIWGSSYLVTRVAVQELPSFWMVGVRFLTAGVLLTAFAAWKGARFPRDLRGFAVLFLLAFFLIVASNGCLSWAARYLPSGLIALIGATTPLVIAVMAMALPGNERLGPRGWLGLALGILGLAILLRPESGSTLALVPVVVTFGSVVAWSAGTHLARLVRIDCDSTAGTAVEMLLGGAVLLGISLATERPPQFPVSWPVVVSMLHLVLLASCVAFLMYFWIMQNVHPAKAATYAYVNPVVAVLLGWMILSEPLTGGMALGAAVTLVGVFLTNTGHKPAPPAPPKASGQEADHHHSHAAASSLGQDVMM